MCAISSALETGHSSHLEAQPASEPGAAEAAGKGAEGRPCAKAASRPMAILRSWTRRRAPTKVGRGGGGRWHCPYAHHGQGARHAVPLVGRLYRAGVSLSREADSEVGGWRLGRLSRALRRGCAGQALSALGLSGLSYAALKVSPAACSGALDACHVGGLSSATLPHDFIYAFHAWAARDAPALAGHNGQRYHGGDALACA